MTSACFSLTGGHDAAEAREASLERFEDLRRPEKAAPERRRGRFPREVVLRGTESSGGDHDVGPVQGVAKRRCEETRVVGHRDPRAHGDTDLEKPGREVQGVGVGAERRQELAAHGEDLRPHERPQSRIPRRRRTLA